MLHLLYRLVSSVTVDRDTSQVRAELLAFADFSLNLGIGTDDPELSGLD